MTTGGARWRKSRTSNASCSCVEVRPSTTGVHVRDSKHVESMLWVGAVGWKVFVGMVSGSSR
ncbi:DUF397 domain-containing protein [Lentzea aerocolonigenes]|uniref:DUF397 domain-containing protein n=1 Tax=Lentzea aerocolonigenes TaxID=68170 RepID=UPI0009DF842D